MPHASLIGVLVAGFGLAFLFGTAANRLRLSPIAGYLLAGIALGPFTPGFVADPNLTRELAEIGVILLMFGVGLHFSLKDLLSVARIAVPGAIGQIAVATLMGAGLSWALGLPESSPSVADLLPWQGLRHQDDLADSASLTQAGQCLRRLAQRQLRADERVDQSLLPELHQRRVGGRDDARLVLAVEPPVQADNAVVLHQQVVGRCLRDPPAGEPDDHQPALEGDALA